MRSWIFQGNPDIFDIDTYLKDHDNITWSIGQKHLASKMSVGDEVFLWRSSGKKKEVAGIVAFGVITCEPTEMEEEAASISLYREGHEKFVPTLDLRITISIVHRSLGAKEIIKRDWLKDDPVVSQMRILKFFSETNYLLAPNEAQRLSSLLRNTGRDWSREESIAGLWAYAHTLSGTVSKLPGSPVAEVALTIGRAVTGVYNKVMNFRAIDPTDKRKGFSAVSHTDDSVWSEFFDSSAQTLLFSKLDGVYSQLWGKGDFPSGSKQSYAEFGEAPDDDPAELQRFAARIRKGQPKFRKNLLEAYANTCVLSGHGPVEVLEAVHIVPHATSGINKLDNGLLMRADLHYLFDADLIRINPSTLEAVIDPSLSGSPYSAFNGKKLIPRADGSQISSTYLEQRWDQTK